MSSSTEFSNVTIVLIAPNVSEQMGGEAIKALQIFQQFSLIDPETIQITHERNERELHKRLGLRNVEYVMDTWVSRALWRSVVFRWLLNSWFSWKAVRLAEEIASNPGFSGRKFVLHQTEPNSPVLPRSISRRHKNVLGPINGNIYYPQEFRSMESASARIRRVLHFPAQWVHRVSFSGLRKSDLVLVAGGKRTRDSLLAAGVKADRMLDTLDCGVRDSMLRRARIAHHGPNLKFIHFGRLVFHKGTALAIRAVAQSEAGTCLDVVGAGPELGRCRALVRNLRLDGRVRFLPWYTSHEELFNSFGNYRGVVLPSLEDANGIVVQEAMALGLPAICLDWGGPQLLIDHEKNGLLVSTGLPAKIVTDLAQQMDRLAQDGSLAETLSVEARLRSEQWRWSRVAAEWVATVKSV